MGKVKAKLWLSLNNDWQKQSASEGQRALPLADGVTEVTLLAEHIGWHYNAVLTGLYFKQAGDIWNAVVKCEMASGPFVSYFTNTSLYALVETVHWYARKGLISWNRDKKPVKRRKHKGVYQPSKRW